MQRPTGPAIGRLGAGQGHQVGLARTVQFPRAAVQLFLASQGPFQALFHAAAAHPLHGGGAQLQGPDYFLVPHGPAGLILIAKQQDASVSLPVRRRPAFGHQTFQFLLLISRQLHPVFPHPHIPISPGYQPILPYQPSVKRCWSASVPDRLTSRQLPARLRARISDCVSGLRTRLVT